MIINANDFKIQTPFRGLICGPSNSGKTRLITKFIKERLSTFSTNFDNIVYCHPHTTLSDIDQTLFQELELLFPPIEFHKGLPSLNDLIHYKGSTLLILEDMIDTLVSSVEYSTLYSVYSSHYNISIITTSQNYFQQGKYAKTMLRNQSFLVLFETRNDRMSANHISRQMFPGEGRFVSNCFSWLSRNVENRVFRYLYIECSTNSPLPGNFPQVRANLFLEFNNNGIIVFQPNDF